MVACARERGLKAKMDYIDQSLDRGTQLAVQRRVLAILGVSSCLRIVFKALQA
jgi:hypothetical protein